MLKADSGLVRGATGRLHYSEGVHRSRGEHLCAAQEPSAHPRGLRGKMRNGENACLTRRVF